MKLKILDTAHHRNGVAGFPFDVVLFKVQREQGVKVGVLFDDPGACAVLDVTLLAAGDIAFGSNSWRGHEYEPELRRAIDQGRDNGPEAGMAGNASIPQRVDRCDAALRRYFDDGVFTRLVAPACATQAAAGKEIRAEAGEGAEPDKPLNSRDPATVS